VTGNVHSIISRQQGSGLFAVTRPVSASIADCELTHVQRSIIDVNVARAQHSAYENLLETLGCTLLRVPAADDLPDSVFVEDTAIVLDELAIVAHPGAASRRGELAAVAEILGRFRSLVWIQSPGTLDGGDVFVVRKEIFVGRSARTNDAGIEQLRAIVAPFRYIVHVIDVRQCLHLKTAVCPVSEDTLLVHPQWVDAACFSAFHILEIDEAEPFAANALRVGDAVIHAAEFPRTSERLASHGIDVVTVPASELAKAEGGVTCCSIVFEP
jgi:dimethylargininase